MSGASPQGHDPLAATMLERQLNINDIIDLDSPASTPRSQAGSDGKRDIDPQSGLKFGQTPTDHALQHYFVTRHPHRHCSVDELLNYNRKWSAYMNENDPQYFKELAKHQAPKFLWVGCADSRVPANEILGLAPGDVFVHRNVANVVYPSDLNCLACIQFGVEQLKIEHLILCGHYECGGIKAAYYDLELGLVDNWVANIRDIKHRYWHLISQAPEDERVAVLCEINAIVQARHIASSTVVQRWWSAYRRENSVETHFGSGVPLISPPERSAELPSSPTMTTNAHHKVTVHGWIYGLADGLIVPLVELGPYDDIQKKCDAAIRGSVAKRVPALAEAYSQRKKSIASTASGTNLVAYGGDDAGHINNSSSALSGGGVTASMATMTGSGVCCGSSACVHRPSEEAIQKALAVTTAET